METIKRRLLSGHEANLTYEVCEFARIRAEDLFEIKADILGEMSRLDPEGPQLELGALVLDNPRTSTREESLERLFAILDELREGGRQSEAFTNLKEKLQNSDKQASTSEIPKIKETRGRIDEESIT